MNQKACSRSSQETFSLRLQPEKRFSDFDKSREIKFRLFFSFPNKNYGDWHKKTQKLTILQQTNEPVGNYIKRSEEAKEEAKAKNPNNIK
jgi:hypothetical protein